MVGAAEDVDELGVRRAQHRAAGDEAAGLERLAERHRARLGDDRLVEVEEGRAARERGGHDSIVGIQQTSTGEPPQRPVHRCAAGGAPTSVHPGTLDAWTTPRTSHCSPPPTRPSPRSSRGSPPRPGLRSWSPRRGPRCWPPGAPRRWCSSAPTSCPRWSSWRRRADPVSRSSRGHPCRPGRSATRCSSAPSGSSSCPVGAELVAELLTDLEEVGRGEGVLVGVVGGSGGAGATTLACGLGQVAAARGPTLVVDLDPLGPGCDRVLALDDAPGVRWDSLGTASGRLSGRSLREAVPRRNGLGVLGWASAASALDAGAVREALSAARRGHDTVVVDLPRAGDLGGRDGRAVRAGRDGRRADGHRCRRRGPVGGRPARLGPGRAAGPWSRC